MQLEHSKKIGLIWLGVTVGFALGILKGLPWAAKRIPWSYELKLADEISSLDQTRACQSESGSLVLNQVMRRLEQAPNLPLPYPVQVKVIPGATQNAFASLGGRIFVYEGLFQDLRTPEEFAGVLAHELEHVEQRHVLEGLVNQAFSAGFLRFILNGDPNGALELFSFLTRLHYSRGQETAADLGGLIRLQNSKIDTIGFEHFFERAERHDAISFLSDHPSSKDRALLAAKYRIKQPEPLLSDSEWRTLKLICK